MNFKLCKYCRAQIPYKAKKCQYCKKTQDVDVAMIVGFAVAFMFIMFWVLVFSADSENVVDNSESTTQQYQVEKETQLETEIQTQPYYPNIDLSDKYKANFVNACTDCGIVASEVKSLKKIADWQSGERYTFNYKGATHSLYLNDDGSINSINFMQSTDIQLYKKGYTSLKYEDFEYSILDFTSLQYTAEQIVKGNLKYPDTANFDWWTTGKYARFYDYYVMQAEFSAQNAFGVTSRHKFRFDCRFVDGTPKLVYYELDGKAMTGKPDVPQFKREEIKQDTSSSTDGSIRISYGILGTYGKQEDFNGNKIVRYYLPSGKYQVTCQARGSGFYVESIATHTENGYKDVNIYETHNFKNVGETCTITIDNTKCITVFVNSEFDIRPMQ